MTKLIFFLLIVFGPSLCPIFSQISSGHPTVVQAVSPSYPAIALASGAEGTVLIEAKIDSEGKVISTRMLKGIRLLGKAGELATQQWLFKTNTKRKIRILRLFFTFEILPEETSISKEVSIFINPYRIVIRRTKPKVVNLPDND